MEHITDLVVIGGGGAGITAALAASDRGIKDIVVLEKRNAPGGNSLFPEGFFAADSQLQKRFGIKVSADECFRQMMDFSHWRLNARLVRTLINESGRTVDWLESLGVRFELRDTPGSINQLRIVFPFRVGKGKTGLGIMQNLIRLCEDRGIRIICNARAKSLIVDSHGCLSGVVVESAGQKYTVHTRSAVIATGGFAGNKTLLKKYLPPFEDGDDVYIGAIPHEGDGVIMAEEVGAAMESVGAMELTINRFPWSSFLFILFKAPYMIWINKYGERFADESSFGAVNNIWKQPGKVSYTLFDEYIKQLTYQQEINPMDISYIGNKFNELDEEFKLNPWLAVERDLREKTSTGRIKIADNWAEIADWMGVSPVELQSTIDEYNLGCERKADFFSKESRFLVPLRQPPYYAIRTVVNLLVTHGVIKASSHMEVLDGGGRPIPGLYVAGDDIGGTDENVYGAIGGHSFGFAITSGRLAGESAAEYVKQI